MRRLGLREGPKVTPPVKWKIWDFTHVCLTANPGPPSIRGHQPHTWKEVSLGLLWPLPSQSFINDSGNDSEETSILPLTGSSLLTQRSYLRACFCKPIWGFSVPSPQAVKQKKTHLWTVRVEQEMECEGQRQLVVLYQHLVLQAGSLLLSRSTEVLTVLCSEKINS